jgi:hypothetical protein
VNPLRKIEVVPNDTPEPPYPADVRAKGWRFDLDVERIENSDTWTLAPADMRPWLLMLWMRAWTQTPCGSLPANDALVAARIGMDPRLFAGNREILMRGWYRCTDGRLYHPVITESVEAMRDSRKAERDKKARQRAKDQALGPDVPGDSTGNDAGHPGESDGSPATGPGTGPGTGSGTGPGTGIDAGAPPPPPPAGDPPAGKAPRKRAPRAASQLVSLEDLIAEGIDPDHAADWLFVRKQKHLPLTNTAWKGMKEAAEGAKLPIAEVVHICAINSWAGFKAKWLEQPETLRPVGPKSTGVITVPGESTDDYLARQAREREAEKQRLAGETPEQRAAAVERARQAAAAARARRAGGQAANEDDGAPE